MFESLCITHTHECPIKNGTRPFEALICFDNCSNDFGKPFNLLNFSSKQASDLDLSFEWVDPWPPAGCITFRSLQLALKLVYAGPRQRKSSVSFHSLLPSSLPCFLAHFLFGLGGKYVHRLLDIRRIFSGRWAGFASNRVPLVALAALSVSIESFCLDLAILKFNPMSRTSSLKREFTNFHQGSWRFVSMRGSQIIRSWACGFAYNFIRKLLFI